MSNSVANNTYGRRMTPTAIYIVYRSFSRAFNRNSIYFHFRLRTDSASHFGCASILKLDAVALRQTLFHSHAAPFTSFILCCISFLLYIYCSPWSSLNLHQCAREWTTMACAAKSFVVLRPLPKNKPLKVKATFVLRALQRKGIQCVCSICCISEGARIFLPWHLTRSPRLQWKMKANILHHVPVKFCFQIFVYFLMLLVFL